MIYWIKGVSFVWSEEIKANLYKELEYELDNKKFFNAKDYYSNASRNTENQATKPMILSNITYAKTLPEKSMDIENTIKGISFSNTIEVSKQTKSVNDLSLEDRKIYKISDLLSANLEETIVIPYNITQTSLALIRKFDWKDILFADIGTAFGIIKNKFNIGQRLAFYF